MNSFLADNCIVYNIQHFAGLSSLVLYDAKLSASVLPMPFKSLQGCLPDIAEVLNVNRATLYERQRALVREGLLEALPGHGRGSGVRATPESVAMLMIGMLASVNLADVGPLARSLSNAMSIDSTCRLTGAKTFHGALSRIFSDEKLAKKAHGISVHLNAGLAAVGSQADQDMDAIALKMAMESRGRKIKFNSAPSSSIFSTRKHPETGLRIGVSIPGDTCVELAKVVSILEGDDQ
jgi:hypothetical protein